VDDDKYPVTVTFLQRRLRLGGLTPPAAQLELASTVDNAKRMPTPGSAGVPPIGANFARSPTSSP